MNYDEMKDEAEEKFNEYSEGKFHRYRSKKELKEELLPIFRERGLDKEIHVKLESAPGNWDFYLTLKHPEKYKKEPEVLTIEKGKKPSFYASRIEDYLEKIRKRPKKKEKKPKKKAVEVPEEYRSPLVDPTTQKLASLFRIEPPETWEEIADIYDTSVLRARESDEITPQSAWSTKVLRKTETELLFRRLEKGICKLVPEEVTAAMEFFPARYRLRIFKSRADKCDDETAEEMLGIYLKGPVRRDADPGTLDRLGFIKYWIMSWGKQEAIENLVKTGYDRGRAEEMVRQTIRDWGKAEIIRALKAQGIAEEEAKRKVERLKGS